VRGVRDESIAGSAGLVVSSQALLLLFATMSVLAASLYHPLVPTMTDRHLPAPLRFLLAARRSELHGLERLSMVCDLVVHVCVLTHALQKERGYSNLHLSHPRDRFAVTLGTLAEHTRARNHVLQECLDDWDATASGNTRLLNAIAHALFRLESHGDLRSRVRERRIDAEQADTRYTQLISSLLSIVFEAADVSLDPGVTGMLVSLLNFMQGKELCGQERACGVTGFTAGWFSDAQKARMLGLSANQQRSLNTFTRFAESDVRAAWEALPIVDSVQQMRDMAQRTSPTQQVDPDLAEIWFDACTQRIDAMHDIELLLARTLAQRCAERIATSRLELEDHRLLLSRYADHATGREPAMIFSVQGRLVDQPSADGVNESLERPILDLMREQTARLQRADEALTAARASLNEKRILDRAKGLLSREFGLTESAAHDRLQRAAMSSGLSMIEVARQIVTEQSHAGTTDMSR